jgi:multidrug efflux pump subunit AcrB
LAAVPLGLSSLGGIVTNHTIVLFEYANREREHDPTLTMERALVLAGTKRLRPIFLTVVTSIAGLLPLAVSTKSLWKPFCWVVIFGLAGVDDARGPRSGRILAGEA